MNGMVPKLRFKQDDGLDFPEWEEKTFEQAVARRTGDEDRHTRPHNWVIDLEHLESGTGRILSKASVEYSLSQKNIFASGDILFGKLRPYLKKYARPDFDGVCSSEIWVLSGITVLNSYLFYVVQSSYFNQLANISSGSKMPRSDWSTIADSELFFPTLPEQQKIAEFLSAIDAKIDAVKRKRDAFERYKKGLMQQIFCQKIRFKKDDGSDFPEWELLEAGNLFSSVSNKKHNGDLPILSITQNSGAVLRDDVGIDIKATLASVNSYKIVEPGDFIISLRSFQGGIEYSNVHGICSPAYTIMKPKRNISDGFYKYFMKSTDFVKRLSLTVVGIRDGKQISYNAFSELLLPYPSLPEQQKIADFLSSMEAKIDAVTTQVQKLEAFKKGLLQQMFV